MKSRMSAHETIRRAIIGGGRNLNASDAATRVIAALPKLIDAAMVERFIAVMDDLTGTPKDERVFDPTLITMRHNPDFDHEPGLSLRDYFAAKAMQGLIAQSMGTALGSDPKIAAEYAYATADAMLAARTAK